jgi:beta-lactamase superfamily II metal-dependent hydrolase
MLDVGQGDSTVVLLPDGHAVVFDCADEHVLTKHLTHWRVPAIEAFILSHLDQDHIGGALGFLQSWAGPVRCVCLSTDRDITDEHDEAKRAIALVDHVREGRKELPGRPRRWEVVPSTRDFRAVAEGHDWSVRLIAPEHAEASLGRAREGLWEDANRYSSILRIEAGGHTMLVGGDAPLISWSVLSAEERKAQIVRIPHHGGALDDGSVPDGWDAAELYRQVGPETAPVSVGTNNAHGHPTEAWVAPIAGGACAMLCTQITARCHPPLERVDEVGRLQRVPDEIAAQRERVLGLPGFKHWSEPQWRHLTDRRRVILRDRLEVPCAGTVAIALYLDGREPRISPPPGGDHEKLVDTFEKPLCRAAGA